jgi:DNA invertase Pin-like site-specific DNA recombinase
VVARLDRLSRNAPFLLSILDSGVEVMFCDLPEVSGAMGRFVVGIMAHVTELEAGLVSERTKAALAAARQRGVRLGATGADVLAPRWKIEADQRAQALRPMMEELQAKGLSRRGIARALTKRKVPTPRGGRWHAETVGKVLERIGS